MSNYIVSGATLTSIANAIRSKTGSSQTFTPAQMISEIEGISSGGGYISYAQYFSSNITSYSGSEEAVFARAFEYCTSLSAVNLPNCAYIGERAFFGAGLSATSPQISLPNCSYIGYEAFTIAGFSYYNLPNCVALGNGAFRSANAQSINLPNCAEIGEEAFKTCYASYINIPKLTTVPERAFQYARVQTISLPSCTSIGGSGFYGADLSNITLPTCTLIGDYAFQECYSLTTASLPAASFITYSAFAYCENLMSLYLTGVQSVPELVCDAIETFYNSPLSPDGSGKIYIPASLYNNFLASDYWATVSNRFVSV